MITINQAVRCETSRSKDCDRAVCFLRVVDQKGQVGCLMESVRERWANPTDINYCKNAIAKRFVDRFHERCATAAPAGG